MLVVTHNPELAARMPRRLRMVDGLIVEQGSRDRDGPPGRFARAVALCALGAVSPPVGGARLARRRRRAPTEAAPASRPTTRPRRRRRRGRPAAPTCRSRIQFRGNRKVEDDAIRVNLRRRRATTLDAGACSATTSAPSGRWASSRTCRSRSATRERRASSSPSSSARSPPIRKIYVAGNDEVGARQDQRGPRPQEGADPRPRQGEEERREDPRPLRREGLLPGRGDLRAASASTRTRSTSSSASTSTPRSRSGASASRQPGRHRRRAARRDADAGGRACSRSSPRRAPTARTPSSATSCCSGLLLRPRLHQREGRQPARRAVARQASLYITIPIDEGPQYRLGKVDFRATCSTPQGGLPQRLTVKPGEIFNRSKLGRGHAEADRLLQGPRLRLRQRHAHDARRREDADRRRDLRDPEGAAGLLRAHQHPRQHQDPRQGHPPRAAHHRGRALQPDAARLLQAARHRARLLREGRRLDQARLGPTTRSRSTSRSPSGPPARSRSAPASRRSRTSSPRRRSRRTTCSAAARC